MQLKLTFGMMPWPVFHLVVVLINDSQNITLMKLWFWYHEKEHEVIKRKDFSNSIKCRCIFWSTASQGVTERHCSSNWSLSLLVSSQHVCTTCSHVLIDFQPFRYDIQFMASLAWNVSFALLEKGHFPKDIPHILWIERTVLCHHEVHI